MFIVTATTTDVFGLMWIWFGSIVVLLVVRIWALLRRRSDRPYSRAITIITVSTLILILAGTLIFVVSRYWWVLFALLFLFPDLFEWLCVLLGHKRDISVSEDKCDLCSSNLYGAGKPHVSGSHRVCAKCHRTIEEAKKEETSRLHVD
jgi:hypothetical protein